jgi:hypothetical protein
MSCDDARGSVRSCSLASFQVGGTGGLRIRVGLDSRVGGSSSDPHPDPPAARGGGGADSRTRLAVVARRIEEAARRRSMGSVSVSAAREARVSRAMRRAPAAWMVDSRWAMARYETSPHEGVEDMLLMSGAGLVPAKSHADHSFPGLRTPDT